MEKGLLNFTSLLTRTALQAAGSGEPTAERHSDALLMFSLCTLEANSGKSCRIPLK